MVDAVLSFEGEGSHQFRILRGQNRFGPTDEIGELKMTGLGLCEVANPWSCFCRARSWSAGHGRLRGHRRHAAIAGRDPGACRTHLARHATARRRRLGSESSVDGAGGARSPLWGAARRTRCLPQRGRRHAYSRAGRRPCGSRSAGLIACKCSASGRRGLWRSIAVRAVRPVAQSAARLKEAAKLGCRAIVPEAAPAKWPSWVTDVTSLAGLVADICRGMPGSSKLVTRR